MLDITFIRHAESEYNKKGLLAGIVDCNLTQKGLEDAKLLRKSLKNDFDFIYCSPLKRTKQTLNAIFPDCKPNYDNRIIERTFGVLDGKPKASVSREKIKLYEQGLYLAPGAESIKELDKRVCTFVEELFQKYHNNEKILVVTHNGILNSVKRNFIKSCDNMWSHNLGMIKLTDDHYQYYKNNKRI